MMRYSASMKAVILVGGSGTRLRPVTYEIPKPLITVKKKPIINHLIDLFFRHGVTEVAMLAAREHEEDFLRWGKLWQDGLPIKNVSIFYEESPRGTFGGLPLLKEWLGTEDFIFSNGDELKDFDVTALVDFQRVRKPIATIALVRVKNPHEYGVPIMEGDAIIEFLEKPQNPPSDYISSGLYILNPDVLKYADPTKEFLMIERDIFPYLAKANQLLGYKLENARWYDCGSLDRWEKAIREW
jgi:mannose-1-phosphate guanylyltransferase/phosphomannomutase